MKHDATWYLTWLILAGLAAGAIFGELLYRAYTGDVPPQMLGALDFVGNTVFMGLLKMVLVPLVASSVIVGVSSIGDPSKLGRVGGFTVFYYFSTMLIAVLIGIFMVTTLQPGDPMGDGSGLDAEVLMAGVADYDAEPESKKAHVQATGEGGLFGVFKNIVGQLIPTNPVGAAAEGRLLPVIAFSLILGVVLTTLGQAGKAMVDVFESLFAAIMKLVEWILWLAPLGVMALVAWTVARIGLRTLTGPLVMYVVTVLSGLAIHAFIVLPLILWVFGRTNPYRYMHQMRAALMTAMGTDSSSATLPVTIESAEQQGGVSRRSARFVLPLGATINMDGTALYEAVAVVFLFQAFGIELGMTEIGIIAVTATLAAVGAAGIPSAGLVTMVIVVEAVNDSLAAASPGITVLPLAAVGVILGIDRIIDMCRTTVNVWGDAVGAKIISIYAPDDEPQDSANPIQNTPAG